MPFRSLIRPGTGWGESVACFLRVQLPHQSPAAFCWQPPGLLHLRPGGIDRASSGRWEAFWPRILSWEAEVGAMESGTRNDVSEVINSTGDLNDEKMPIKEDPG